MAFSVKKSGGVSQLRSGAFVSHARVGVGIYVIAAVLVIAVLPSLELPRPLALLLLIPLIWNQWARRGWFVAFDEGGLTEVLNREEGIRLRWEELAGFTLRERPAPSNLLFLGRGDTNACWVVEALPKDGEPQLLWATAGYGTAVAQPTARLDTQEVADYLEARRVDAGATATGTP